MFRVQDEADSIPSKLDQESSHILATLPKAEASTTAKAITLILSMTS
jgi:hypothetical protein